MSPNGIVATMTESDLFSSLSRKGLSQTPSRNFANHFYFRDNKYLVYFDSDTANLEIFVSIKSSNAHSEKSMADKYIINRFTPSYIETLDGQYRMIAVIHTLSGKITVSHTRQMSIFEQWLIN